MGCKLNRILWFLGPAAAVLGTSAFSLASATYVVKKGETLSKILGKKIAGPVWGNSGSLRRSLPLNSQIKDPDVVYVGQLIYLPAGEEVRTPASAQTIGQTNAETTSAPSPSDGLVKAPKEVLQVIQASREEPSRAILELSPFYGFTRISSTDKVTGSPATLTSSLSAGADFRYVQPWNDSFRTFFHLNLGELIFEQPTNSAQSLQDRSNFMSGAGLGAEIHLSKGFSFTLSGDYQKEAFSRAASTTSVAVDAVSIPALGGSLSLDLLRTGVFTIGISGQYSELFQAATSAYTVLQGNMYGGKIYIKQDLGGSALQTELRFFSIQQNTSFTNQSESDLSLQLRWFLPFGKKEEETH